MYEDCEYEVQRIVAMRRKKNCTTYLVKWVGYHESQSTWQPEEFLKNAPEIIEEFELRMKKAACKPGPQKKYRSNKNKSTKSNELISKTKCSKQNGSLNAKTHFQKTQTERLCTLDEDKPFQVINLLSDSSKFSEDNKSNNDKQQNSLSEVQPLQKDQIIDRTQNEKKIGQNKEQKGSPEQHQREPQLPLEQNTKDLPQKIQLFSSRCITIKQVVRIKGQTVVLFESKGKKYKSSVNLIKKYHPQDLQAFYDKQRLPIEPIKHETYDQK